MEYETELAPTFTELLSEISGNTWEKHEELAQLGTLTVCTTLGPYLMLWLMELCTLGAMAATYNTDYFWYFVALFTLLGIAIKVGGDMIDFASPIYNYIKRPKLIQKEKNAHSAYLISLEKHAKNLADSKVQYRILSLLNELQSQVPAEEIISYRKSVNQFSQNLENSQFSKALDNLMEIQNVVRKIKTEEKTYYQQLHEKIINSPLRLVDRL